MKERIRAPCYLVGVQKGLNKRERSRAKRLQTIRKAFVHTFDYGFF